MGAGASGPTGQPVQGAVGEECLSKKDTATIQCM